MRHWAPLPLVGRDMEVVGNHSYNTNRTQILKGEQMFDIFVHQKNYNLASIKDTNQEEAIDKNT